MSTFKATRNKRTESDVFKATKNKALDTTVLYNWETKNKSSVDAIKKYNSRIEAGEWLSPEDLSGYKSAVDNYIASGNALRDIGMRWGGASYTEEDNKSWADQISGLQNNVSTLTSLHGEYKSNDDFQAAKKAYEEYAKEHDAFIKADLKIAYAYLDKAEREKNQLNYLASLPEEIRSLKSDLQIAEFAFSKMATRENKDRVDKLKEKVARLEAMWQESLTTYGGEEALRALATEKTNTYNEHKTWYENATWAQKYESYKQLMNAEDFAENSQFESTYVGGEELGLFGDQYAYNGHDDIKYDYINKSDKAIGIRGVDEVAYGSASSGTTWGYLQTMTKDEVAIFNYLYKTQSPDKAYSYVNFLTPELEGRAKSNELKYWAKYAEEDPFKASVFSALISPMKGFSYVGQLADYAKDGEINPNAEYNKYSYVPTAIRTQVASNWSPLGQFAYQTGMSMADFVVTTAVSGGNGTLASAIMGSGAAADTVLSAKERGLDDQQAFTLGTIAGLAEFATEKMSIDALFDAASLGKNALGYVLKNALTEGGEEVASSVINTLADIIISKDKSEWAQAIAAYEAQGMSEDEAFWRAIVDQAGSLGLDFLGGAISGGVLGGAGAVGGTAVNQIQRIGNRNALGAQIMKNDGVGALTDYSLDRYGNMQSKTGLKGAKLASKVANKATARNVGKLAEFVNKEAFSSNKSTIKDALKKQGLSDNVADKLARYILDDETLSDTDIDTIENSRQYQRAMDEVLSDPELNVISAEAEINSKAEKTQSNPTSENTTKAENATEAKSEGAESNKKNEGGIANTDIKGVEVNGDSATFTTTDGKALTRGSFNFASSNMDYVADAAVEKVSRVKGFTNEAATAMIKGYDDSISPWDYINAYGTAFALGAKGIGFSEVRHVLNKNAISEKTAHVAYLLGQQSAENSKNGLKNESKNGTINKEKTEGKNESTESVRLRNGSKRNGSKNSEGSLRSVESGTGKAESRGEVRRIADSEAAALLNEGREVTVADLGIRGGSSEATVRVFSKSKETAKMKKARKAAEARGLKITFIAGDNMLISEGNGTYSAINGYILGDNIIVRVDHPLYTADQITRHEIGHDMVAKGEVDINKVRERLAKMLDPEDYQAVAEAYADAYRGTNLDADAIFEELICDSLGDMNIFAERNAATAKLFKDWLPEIKKAASESKAPTQTRGSPEGKASREINPKKKNGKLAKYLSESKVGKANMDYIYHQLLKLYSGISYGIADGVAIEHGNKVYIVDSGRENGKLDFGVRRMRTVSADVTRAEFIRRENDKARSNGHISNELLGKFEYGRGSDTGRNLRRESGSELQADTGKSQNKQGGVSRKNADNRGVTESKASRELDSLGNELSKEQHSTIRSFIYEYANQEYFNIDLSDERGNVIGSLEYEGRINPTRIINDVKHYYETGEIREQSGVDKFRSSRELDALEMMREGAKIADEENEAKLNKAQKVAKVKGQLEAMNVGRGEIMAALRVADKLFENYGGSEVISDFRYDVFEATRLALKSTDEDFETAYGILYSLAKEVANNPKNLGGDAQLLADIKKDIRSTRLTVHEKDKTSGEFDSFGGYGEFKKSYFGKLRLANDGVQVDARYAELQNLYGTEFFPEVNTVSEQLLRMAELLDTPLSDYMMLSDAEIDASTDEIVQDLFADLGNVWSNALKRGKPLIEAVGTDGLSNRALLASALEDAAKFGADKKTISQYKANIESINAQERNLLKIRSELAKLSFSKGKRDTARIKELRVEAAEIENRINTYDKSLLNLESTTALKNLLAREKSKLRKDLSKKAAESRKEALARAKETALRREAEIRANYQRRAENRTKSEIRLKIRNFKQKLESALQHPTDNAYVPSGLAKAIIDVCLLIDTDTELYKSDGSINKAQEKRNETKTKLLELKAEYDNIKTSSDYVYISEYDEEISAYLAELSKNYADRPLSEMSLDELSDFYEILRSIDDTLRDAKKLIGWVEAMDVYEAGDRIASEQAEILKRRGNKPRSVIKKASDSLMDLTISPVRNIERMSDYNEDSPLLKLFNEFEVGVRAKNKFTMEAYKLFNDLTTGKNAKVYDEAMYNPFGEEYTDTKGRKFRVTKMQMMQAIMSYDRETANNLNHIQRGGFEFADISKLKSGKVGEAISNEYSHRVTGADQIIMSFAKALEGDTWAKEYMAAAREFFDVMAKDAVNDTYLELKHRIVAKDKYYIPFEVDKRFVNREISGVDGIQQTINSYGMLKEMQKGADQPIIITGLNNVLQRHIDMVGNVKGLAIPIRNFNKVWNARTKGDSETISTVQAAIEESWGKSGTNLITQTVQDLQSKRPDTQSHLYKTIKSGYIAGQFAFNLSVVLKQMGSLFTASSMLNFRDPVSMISNLFYTMANHKSIAAEVDKYTATAWMRRQGLSDAELASLSTEGHKNVITRSLNKVPAILNPTKWITGMDYMVALSLWKYAKQTVAKRTGLQGEELLRATAEYYDSVIENTQSMSDVLHRPEIQKRTDILSEAFGMFKTDLYQTAGQLRINLGRFIKKPTRANAAALAKTVYGATLSTLWATVAINTLMALLRYKVNPFRDEEDEITFESWLKRTALGVAGDVFGYILPIAGGEIVGIVEDIIYGENGEAVDSVAISAINTIIDSVKTIISSTAEGELQGEDLLDLATQLLQLMGLPANNVKRTIQAIKLHAEDISKGEFLSFEAGLEKPNAQRLYSAMLSGDKDRIEKASRLYKDQAAIDAAIRKMLRENDSRIQQAAMAQLSNRNADRIKLQKEIKAEGHFAQDYIVEATNAEANYVTQKLREAKAYAEEGKIDEYNEIYDALLERGYTSEVLDFVLKRIKTNK